MMIKRGGAERARYSRAWIPSANATTLNPSISRISLRKVRVSGSSSTSITFCGPRAIKLHTDGSYGCGLLQRKLNDKTGTFAAQAFDSNSAAVGFDYLFRNPKPHSQTPVRARVTGPHESFKNSRQILG